MGDVDLNSLWSYDLDPTYDLGSLEPATADWNACPHCAKKQIKLDTEHSVNADLIRCVAKLTRENAAVAKDNEALRAKLWSLEHGGGVAQPAPPGPGDSGGGVAATPSASASARALSCSPSTSSSGPSGIENGGPAAASPKMRAHEDAVETRQALKSKAAKALATGGEGVLTDRTEAVSGAPAAAPVDPDGVVVDAPGSSGAPEACWKCRDRDRSSAACEVRSVVGSIASETAIANGRGAGAKRAATVLAAGGCRGGEGGLHEGIVCPVLKMAKLATPLKGTKLAETVERATAATPTTASAKFAAAISLYSEERGKSPPAATSAPPAPAPVATPFSGEMAAARKHAPRPSTVPFSPPLERNSGGGGDSCQQQTRNVPRSTSSESLAGSEGTEARGRLQGYAGKSERRNTAATSASARALSLSPPPHPPSSPASSSAVHSVVADAGEASHSSAGGFHRASTSSAVDSAAAAVTSCGRAATNMKVVKEEPVEATEAPLGGSRGVVAAAVSSSRSLAAATVTRRSHRDSEEAGFGATAAKGNGDGLCTIRRMHVLQCFLCGRFPAQRRESRIVVFCSTCPRKACLSCHENQVSKDRPNWTQGKDAYGRFFEIPKCRECINDVDDRIPSLEPKTAALLRGSGRDASTEDLRATLRELLRKLLDWLEGHDLAHFFVHDVDAEEYPDYPKKVKNPMNLSRMRRRLEAGDYDIGLQDFIVAPLREREGRNIKTAVMEDVDWVLRNCIKFNGELAAISRSAYIFHKRADNYLRAYIDPLVKLLGRRGRQGAAAGHTASCDGVYNGGGGRDRCGLRYRPVVAGRRDSDGAINRRDDAGGSGNGNCYGEADNRTRRWSLLGRQRHHSAPHSTATAAEKSVARACTGNSSKSSSKPPPERSASLAFGAGAESGDGDRTGDQDEAEEIDGVDEAEWFDVRGTSAKSAAASAAAPAKAAASTAAAAAADGGRRRRGARGFRERGSSKAASVVDLEIEKALAREEEAEGQRSHGHQASIRRADFYQEMADALHLVGLPASSSR